MKKTIKTIIHYIYIFLGKINCNLMLLRLIIKDRFDPPKEEAILFVAHPDDDALFFNKFIEKNKPYVVLMYTGWSLRRIKDFKKVMKLYGVRYRAYATLSKEPYDYTGVRRKTEKHVADCLKIGDFKTVVTHNSTGEYGHTAHRVVHESVFKVCKGKSYEMICPVSVDEIGNYPLSEAELEKKTMIFEKLYSSEAWVMTEEEAKTPIWFKNEKLETVVNN